MKRCYECFCTYADELDVCPGCGTPEITEPVQPIHLLPGTILDDRYIVGRAIGSGGFGIVYKAYDTKLETVVAIKEFFSKLMTRAKGQKEVIVNRKSKAEYEYRKERFLSEARTMAKFSGNRSIPSVFETFDENKTSYIVMELLKGKPLDTYLKENGGKIDPEFAVFIANEIAVALKSLHEKNVIHCDIAPDNIFICDGKEIRLKVMDLGAAKLSDKTDDVVDIVMKPGYSPVEQYDVDKKNIGPWTDIYALGATLYVMLTGIKPEESTNRKIRDLVKPPHEEDPSIPENLSNAVMKAMAVEKHMRFRSVDEFIQAINGERKVLPLEKERRSRRMRQFLGIGAAILAVLIGTIYVSKNLTEKAEEGFLRPADVSIWFSVEDGSSEEEALQAVAADFIKSFPDITIDVRAIPAAQYAAELSRAADEGNLPSLFESTDLPDEILGSAVDIRLILQSEQAKDCLFLDQYDQYYDAYKRVPLGIEVPVAFVITSGAQALDFQEDYFNDLLDFGAGTKISLDDQHRDLVLRNIEKKNFLTREAFMDNSANKSAVMLSSTMEINDVRQSLTNYQKKYVYYKGKAIHCGFVYEWSIGAKDENEKEAAERLLTWMLGNVYQNLLLVSMNNEGQLPLNKTCFLSKIDTKNLAPIRSIYGRFVFDR